MVDIDDPRENNDSQMIFAGFAGFSCVLLSLTLFYFKISFFYFESGGYPVLLIVVALVTLFLYCASLANDFLITKRGGFVLLIVGLVGGVVAPVAYFSSGFNVLLLPFIAAGTTSAILLWGSYLASQKHHFLLFISAVAFVFTGAFSILVLELSLVLVAAIVSIFYLLAWFCYIYVKDNLHEDFTLVSSARSRERSVVGRGNRFTLITIGFLLGVSLLLLCKIDLDIQVTILIFSGSVTTAGLIILVLRSRLHRRFEDAARRSLGAAAALCLVPFPFVPPLWQAACASILLLDVVLNFIILIDAVAETSRFNMVSPIWITGSEGAICALGALCGMFIFWGGLQVFSYTTSLIVTSFSSVALCSVMQIFIENQTYPFLEDVIDESKLVYDSQSNPRSRFAGNGGAGWREKLDVVTEQYELSPRQKEVMELLAKGRDAKYIMSHFYISRSTTKTHIYNLYKKLEVHSRQEMLDLVERTDIDTDRKSDR
jgi:DNA-binding CsgD family transcriptional regulator